MPPARPPEHYDIAGKPHGTHLCVPYKPTVGLQSIHFQFHARASAATTAGMSASFNAEYPATTVLGAQSAGRAR